MSLLNSTANELAPNFVPRTNKANFADKTNFSFSAYIATLVSEATRTQDTDFAFLCGSVSNVEEARGIGRRSQTTDKIIYFDSFNNSARLQFYSDNFIFYERDFQSSVLFQIESKDRSGNWSGDEIADAVQYTIFGASGATNNKITISNDLDKSIENIVKVVFNSLNSIDLQNMASIYIDSKFERYENMVNRLYNCLVSESGEYLGPGYQPLFDTILITESDPLSLEECEGTPIDKTYVESEVVTKNFNYLQINNKFFWDYPYATDSDINDYFNRIYGPNNSEQRITTGGIGIVATKILANDNIVNDALISKIVGSIGPSGPSGATSTITSQGQAGPAGPINRGPSGPAGLSGPQGSEWYYIAWVPGQGIGCVNGSCPERVLLSGPRGRSIDPNFDISSFAPGSTSYVVGGVLDRARLTDEGYTEVNTPPGLNVTNNYNVVGPRGPSGANSRGPSGPAGLSGPQGSEWYYIAWVPGQGIGCVNGSCPNRVLLSGPRGRSIDPNFDISSFAPGSTSYYGAGDVLDRARLTDEGYTEVTAPPGSNVSYDYNIVGDRGPSGPKGQNISGPRGSSGPKGLDGSMPGEQSLFPPFIFLPQFGPASQITGPTGPAGPSGLEGLISFFNQNGPAGDRGPSGVRGVTGPSGTTLGPSGPGAPINAFGFTGPRGPSGISGPSAITVCPTISCGGNTYNLTTFTRCNGASSIDFSMYAKLA